MGEGCRALIAAIYRILLLRFSFCEGPARADPLVRGNVLVLRRKTLPYSRVPEVFERPVHALTCTGITTYFISSQTHTKEYLTS